MVPGVVALMQLVPAAELGADRVPQQLHQLDPLDGLDAVRAAQVRIQVGPDIGAGEVVGAGADVDQSASLGSGPRPTPHIVVDLS
jgi:hypothetical protein